MDNWVLDVQNLVVYPKIYNFLYYVHSSIKSVAIIVVVIRLFISFRLLFTKSYIFRVFIVIACILLVSLSWGSDLNWEFLSYRNNNLKLNFKLGIILFIFSEVMFFISFFWGFFANTLSPTIRSGILWPRFIVHLINPYLFPLLNTLILLRSGFFVTLAHEFLLVNKKPTIVYLTRGIILGLYFIIIQFTEYKNRGFSITDSITGSVFFTLTGFHGLHVTLGVTLLTIVLFRFLKSQHNESGSLSNNTDNLGFELSVWYWHFVDVVWLFLYTFLYWWVF